MRNTELLSAPRAGLRPRRAAFAQATRSAGAEQCSAKPPLHPPERTRKLGAARRFLEKRLLTPLLQALQRQLTRRELYELDERQLRDIGVSRADALREAAKPFWKR